MADPREPVADAPQVGGLASALAEVQKQLPSIVKGKTAWVKTKTGGEYTYTYADLADIQPQVLPLLAAQGLAWTCKPTALQDGRFVLMYRLLHTSGESEGGAYPLPDPGVRTPQEIGSAITYARRYTFCCVVGVVADEDDDGQVANVGHEPRRAPVKEPYDDPPRKAASTRPAAEPEVGLQLQVARERLLHASMRVRPEEMPEEARRGWIVDVMWKRNLDPQRVADLTRLAQEWETTTPPEPNTPESGEAPEWTL